MIKVTIQFNDGTVEEFWAKGHYSDIVDRMVRWTESDTGNEVSYPLYQIRKIIEEPRR